MIDDDEVDLVLPAKKERNRPGRPSEKELEFIRLHCGDKSPEWIARELNRNVDVVKKHYHIAKSQAISAITTKDLDPDNDYDLSIKLQLRNREDFETIRNQYSAKELLLFEFYWVRSIKQMPDLTHTEEMQVIKTIHLEILMSRILIQKKSLIVEMEMLQEQIELEQRKRADNRDENKIIMCIEQKHALAAAESSHTKEFSDILEKYNKLMGQMKGTRDQRLARVESSQFNFADWIRLHNEDKRRKQESLEAELSKIATNKEVRRLGELHQFADGTIDRPILNSDTVMLDDVILIEKDMMDDE